MTKCIFCEIVAKRKKDYIVWEDKQFMGILNIFPRHLGHMMIIPKRHIDYCFDLTDKEYMQITMLAKRFAKPLREVTNAKRIAIVISGFNIAHVHVQLVPLFNHKELFDIEKYKRASPKQLEKMQAKLLDAFSTIKKMK